LGYLKNSQITLLFDQFISVVRLLISMKICDGGTQHLSLLYRQIKDLADHYHSKNVQGTRHCFSRDEMSLWLTLLNFIVEPPRSVALVFNAEISPTGSYSDFFNRHKTIINSG